MSFGETKRRDVGIISYHADMDGDLQAEAGLGKIYTRKSVLSSEKTRATAILL